MYGENKPMEWGSLSASKKVKDFILVNGDTVFDINLNDFVNLIKKIRVCCTNAK